MPSPFLSSEEYDERAHQLYNEGEYDQALAVLKEGLAIYPEAVELHIGVGYAHLAREEYAWARRAFDEALVLDAEHEDALAGIAEAYLKFGMRDEALGIFQRTLELGYGDDPDLMLQIGRSLFREGLIEVAKGYFELAVVAAPDNSDAIACVGYARHRLGDDDSAVETLREALKLAPSNMEARIYLGNIYYDRGDYEVALYHLDKSSPDDHWDELGIWRLIELRKSIYKLRDDDREFNVWRDRIRELAGDPDPIDEMLAEIEANALEAEEEMADQARGQLEVFGSLLTSFADTKQDGVEEITSTSAHRIITGGQTFEGTWDQIVEQMRDHSKTQMSVEQYMKTEARRGYGLTGIKISAQSAESFIRGSANAGLLRIDR